MPHKDPVARREYNKRRTATPEYKARKRELYKRPKNLETAKRYWQSERGKAVYRRHAGLPDPTRPTPERCECCNGLPTGRGGLHLDHDHATGTFRGWLCSKCNHAIGLLGDAKLGVSFALAYLTLNA